jgi:hypothetical protein
MRATNQMGVEFVKTLKAAAWIGLLSFLLGGCTDKGGGPFGAGPDDRLDRGGGPDTITVNPSADTYFERTVVDGKYLLFGSLSSKGFEAVSFITFENLPASADEIEDVKLILHVTADKSPYYFSVSKLEEAPPSEYPFWPGPPNGTGVLEVRAAKAVKDTLAPLEGYLYVEVDLDPAWIAGWIENPSSNYGLRISGGTIDVSGSGIVERRYYGNGLSIEGYELSPKLQISQTGKSAATYVSTNDFYIFRPSINTVGQESYVRVGSIFGYETLLRFSLDGFPDDASVNKALLFLTVDRYDPDLNDGIFDVIARPVVGAWKEDSTNVNVELDPASTDSVEVDAEVGGSRVVEIDVTALVDLFTEGGVLNLAIQRTGTFEEYDKVALSSSETPIQGNAPSLKVVFTTPPGRRY